MTCSICKGANHNKRSCPKNSKVKSTPTATQERSLGTDERTSSSNTCKRRGAGSGYRKNLRVVGQGVFVLEIEYTCISQGLASSKRVANTDVQSSAHVTGDIGYQPTKGLKWKGKQAITQRQLQVQTQSKAAKILTRAKAKKKSPLKST